ncbi:MAG TPA: EAL domain-containing protein, partial [Actinomycetes bacterium]|nr:EAL domain-containing protein [Actinomycetes bacterium]
MLYQPIVSLKEGRLVGVEALARWEQPGRGLLLPSEFVPFAEDTGLIVPVGAWVLEEACRQTARWRAGPARPLAPAMHVNLSPRQFAEPHLVDLIAGALADTGTDPDRLCLEVTERALAANPVPGRRPGSSRAVAAGVEWRNRSGAAGVPVCETQSVEGRPLDDQELVEQARGGDARAYEA